MRGQPLARFKIKIKWQVYENQENGVLNIRNDEVADEVADEVVDEVADEVADEVVNVLNVLIACLECCVKYLDSQTNLML